MNVSAIQALDGHVSYPTDVHGVHPTDVHEMHPDVQMDLFLDARSNAERSLREWFTVSGRTWTQLASDESQLKQWSRRPDLLLQRLAKREVLVALGGGAYMLPGTYPLAGLHARMQQLGEYMVSYRSGLLEREWIMGTYGSTLTIAVPGGHISRPKLRLGSRKVEITRMVGHQRWFGYETVSCEGGWYIRADRERLLLDLLDRPRISGSMTEIRDVWAKQLSQINSQTLLAYSVKYGSSMVRRAGWWLEQFGYEKWADQMHHHRGQSGAIWLDGGKQYNHKGGQWQLDKRWGVRINLPNDVWHGAQELSKD